MPRNTPIYLIAKNIGITSNKILLACKSLGIYAKGSTKRLNEDELEKVMNYFENGKNVSDEVIDINSKNIKKVSPKKKVTNELTQYKYFPNRLIG